MSKQIKLLPTVSKAAKTLMSKVSTGQAKVAFLTSKRVSPHIHFGATMIIEKATKKSDYTKDLEYLIKKLKVPVSVAAKQLEMSTSYAYKLLSNTKK